MPLREDGGDDDEDEVEEVEQEGDGEGDNRPPERRRRGFCNTLRRRVAAEEVIFNRGGDLQTNLPVDIVGGGEEGGGDGERTD